MEATQNIGKLAKRICCVNLHEESKYALIPYGDFTGKRIVETDDFGKRIAESYNNNDVDGLIDEVSACYNTEKSGH